MSIRYYIYSELNIAFLFCEGVTPAKSYFKAVYEIMQDKRYKRGMIRIADLFSSEEDFDLQDMRSAIRYNEQIVSQKTQQDHTVLLSNSTGIHQFVESMKLLSTNVNLLFDAFYSLDEAIVNLGLSDKKQEIADFYNRCKYQEE